MRTRTGSECLTERCSGSGTGAGTASSSPAPSTTTPSPPACGSSLIWGLIMEQEFSSSATSSTAALVIDPFQPDNHYDKPCYQPFRSTINPDCNDHKKAGAGGLLRLGGAAALAGGGVRLVPPRLRPPQRRGVHPAVHQGGRYEQLIVALTPNCYRHESVGKLCHPQVHPLARLVHFRLYTNHYRLTSDSHRHESVG